ncbi:hypothetical protein Q9L58_004894 [Maublancomyces gigas]|uniref:Myb-like domain-containing protein n=1 Tax=Discina gigas TaxID=1032678 RepID=A0ABR3GJJ0_9PEZI
MRGANPSQPVIPERAEDMPLHLLSPSPNVRSMLDGLQPLVIPLGFASLSRSDPPTPPGGPPPTPRRRAMNELSRSDPPTPPRGPPPTPGRHEADMFNSLSRCDPPSPPSGPPPSPRHSNGFGSFDSLSRRDPPTPPSGPPPSPRRRDIFNDLSKPTLPKSPPRRREARAYTGLSRSNPPSPPNGPPPTPGRFFSGYNAWTTDELDLLMFVCRSSVELGWHQIAGLFHGKDVGECRRKYREIQRSEVALLDQRGEQGCDSDDSRSYCEPLQLYISTDDPVPIDLGLSRGPSPVGSPVYDRLTIKSWEFNSDVECVVDVEMPRKKKTIAHLSDELNFALDKGWDSVMNRVQSQHASSQHSSGAYWTTAPSFLQMVE